MKGVFNVSISVVLMFISAVCYANNLIVENGYARETIPGTTVSAAYFSIYNESEMPMFLTHVSSSRSEKVELHEHTMLNGMMQMRQVSEIKIGAKTKTKLQPSGHHIMIFDLLSPLKQGQFIDLVLYFNDGSQQSINLPISSIKQEKNHHHH